MASQQAGEKKKSKSWASWARETAHTAQKAMGSVAERELTEEDREFDEVCNYINALQPQMVIANSLSCRSTPTNSPITLP